MSDIFPSPSILVRLRLKIRQQLRPSYMDINELSPEELVSLVNELPSFAIAELWKDFHIGSNLDSGNQITDDQIKEYAPGSP